MRLEVPADLVIPIVIRVETTFLHDALIAALVGTRAVDVVERTRIDALLEEQGLTKTGVTDPAQAAALGKVLGANAIAVGTLRDLELGGHDNPPLPYTKRVERVVRGRIRFDFRLFDVETSRVLEAGSVEALQERNVGATRGDDPEGLRLLWNDVQQEAAERFGARVVDVLRPLRIVSVQGRRAELNRGTASGVRAGVVCDVIDAKEARVGEVTVSNASETAAAGELGGDATAIQADMLCRLRPAVPPPPPAERPDPLRDRW
jgi:hypothetical protein